MSIGNFSNTSCDVNEEFVNLVGPLAIRQLIRIMWQSYYDLIRDNVINNTDDEDTITQEWCSRINIRWAFSSLRTEINPIHQYGDKTMANKRGKKPTIDFCFRSEFSTNTYFGVECKKLDINRQKLVLRYIDTGVINFITGRYGSRSIMSSIVGYITEGSVSDLIMLLNDKMQKVNPITYISKDNSWCEDEQHFISEHMRETDSKQILLHHLFFIFC